MLEASYWPGFMYSPLANDGEPRGAPRTIKTYPEFSKTAGHEMTAEVLQIAAVDHAECEIEPIALPEHVADAL